MAAAEKLALVSVEDYLAGELQSSIKHEYLGGVVYAMSGGRNVHNDIAVNIVGSLHGRLLGQPCKPCNSDTKVRIRFAKRWRFYYPDAFVVCRPNPPDDSFQDEPVVIFEVLSKSTRRIDEGEKKDVYLTIPSLSAYVLVEQHIPAATVFRRATDFEGEVLSGLDAILELPEIAVSLPLREIYNRVEFRPGDDGNQD